MKITIEIAPLLASAGAFYSAVRCDRQYKKGGGVVLLHNSTFSLSNDGSSSILSPSMFGGIRFYKEDIIKVISSFSSSLSITSDFIPASFIKKILHLTVFSLE